MTLLQALAYFLREALVSLRRSWKVSLLAVVTIGVSLFVGGGFLLAATNLAEQAERWREEAKVVVYLQPTAAAEVRAAVVARARAAPWAAAVEEVGPEVAAERFRQAFPSLGGLVEGEAGDSPLPPSVEIRPVPGTPPGEIAAWAEAVRAEPAVDMVDDDRDWLERLDTLIAAVRGIGLALGAVLLGAAIFTIAAVIRLTAFLYHDEISVMRLVGATEFFIRGPFYAEGLLQGLLGGVLAVGGLYGAWRAAVERSAAGGLLSRLLLADFLGLREALLLVALGAAAGFAGALLSLRREDLGSGPAEAEPEPQATEAAS
ncbi:MAG TPA: permease-like cell division protein FtsX [Thermoanaerobaculia bacterium]|nr:permease-like cell division protein FtsX [Thermoanaerobaculia bacterium]